MPRQITTQGGTFEHWRRLIQSLLANLGELAHLDAPRIKLEGLTDEALLIVKEQRILAARRQAASKRLLEILVEGRRLADFVHTGVREYYGTRSEKLTEFGLQPFRGRKAPKPQEPEEPTAPEASSLSSNAKIS